MNMPWNTCKRLLIIRADNMGDVIMTTPALRALKETFGAHITLLTSSMAHRIVPFIPNIDDMIVADLPWVKAGLTLDAQGLQDLITILKRGRFDAAIIFTVYSQNPLPAAMLAMLAGIPKRLAYCRENPYALLTDWVPDPEPYRYIQHQVERDLKLVNSIGAFTTHDQLELRVESGQDRTTRLKLQQAGINLPPRYIILHPGVSEVKRQYPVSYWKALTQLTAEGNIPALVTGTAAEKELAAAICGHDAGKSPPYNVAGLLDISDFIALIDGAAAVVTVNTATVHIAAARQKPVIVLYALTNPQHTPWRTQATTFTYSIADTTRSRNEVVSYVHDNKLEKQKPLPTPTEIMSALQEWWNQ